MFMTNDEETSKYSPNSNETPPSSEALFSEFKKIKEAELPDEFAEVAN